MLSLETCQPQSTILQEKPYFAIKCHYNQLSAERLEKQTEENGFESITYDRITDRLRLHKMRPGDIVFLIHSSPKRYQGCSCIGEVVDVVDSTLKLKFLRYLKRNIELEELRKIDAQMKSTNRIFVLSENQFVQILQLENQKSIV